MSYVIYIHNANNNLAISIPTLFKKAFTFTRHNHLEQMHYMWPAAATVAVKGKYCNNPVFTTEMCAWHKRCWQKEKKKKGKHKRKEKRIRLEDYHFVYATLYFWQVIN